MTDRKDPKNEGHTREWQDRARVMLDAKKAAGTEASPNQSPAANDEHREADENSSTDINRDDEKDDRVY